MAHKSMALLEALRKGDEEAGDFLSDTLSAEYRNTLCLQAMPGQTPCEH